MNIGTLTGRSRELADMLAKRRVQVACIQETRWAGAKCREIGDGYKLYYNGSPSKKNGVGIVVSEMLRDNVVEVCRVSDRLMSLKFDLEENMLRVVCCYAPQVGCTDHEKEQFWDELDEHLRTIDVSETVLLGGDLNGHVGAERDGFPDIHGGNGFGSRNEDGERILTWAEAHDLAITNTFFRKRESHLITYESGGRKTQIDYWLLKRTDLKLAMDCKVIPSDILAPQHRLLILDLRMKLKVKRVPKTGPPRIKWWNLSRRQEQLREALQEITPDDGENVNERWNNIAGKVRAVASEKLGRTKPGKRYIEKEVWWWNEEVQEMARKKKRLFRIWRRSQDTNDRQRYKEAKLETKRAVARAKESYYAGVYDELTAPGGANKVYRLAKARHRATEDFSQASNIKDENHHLLTEPADILRRWSEYFSAICNEEFPHPPINSTVKISGPVPKITRDEVAGAIRKMNSGKSTGPDDLPIELWKALNEKGVDILSAVFNAIIETGEVPQEWTESITVPVWKNKGDVNECGNYRPIRLLCHSMKIFERILDGRLRNITEITTNQCGFVKGCGTTDAVHAVRLLMEKHREKKQPLHLAFLDLEKAFDRVPHALIWHALRDHGVPEAYVGWVQMMYRNVTSRVRCPVGLSPKFPIRVGVHQGSALSPLLFILCIDTVTRNIQAPHPWSLLYADDVCLAATNREELNANVQLWKNRLGEHGLRLNLSKTEYLQCGEQTDGTLKVDGTDIPKTTNFKYLGSVLTADGDSLPDARARVAAAWLQWRRVTGVLCDKRMPTRLKSKVYKTVVRSTAMYTSECRPNTTAHDRVLHVMEMRMLRFSLGLTLLDHAQNEEVRSCLGVAAISEKLRESRLRWFGHVARAPASSVVQTAMQLEVPGMRPRGRPKMRWRDTINDDLRRTHLSEEDASDRSQWRRAYRHADPAPCGRRQRR